MAVFKVVCPQCRSDQVHPTFIGNDHQCIPCGLVFDAMTTKEAKANSTPPGLRGALEGNRKHGSPDSGQDGSPTDNDPSHPWMI